MSRSPLDNPNIAAHAWVRFRRFMRWWALFTLAIVGAALGWMVATGAQGSIHLYIATALGVGLTMLLTGALMGLLFLSSGTGHDEAVRDFDRDDRDQAG